MAKRRSLVEEDSENEAAASSPASKRAKTDEVANNVADLPLTQFQSQSQSLAADNDEEQPSQEEEGEDLEEDDGEKEFEEKYQDAVQASIESKKSISGRVAQHGIIQKLEMHQFMCHRKLKFEFGPQINFIIGHNGSGKSAVLSAITVALGGKANSTGRGNGLKSFIREGQSVAEVSITIMNEGEEAYKPDIYGKSIIITRRFTKDGGSSYKIKNKDEKVISTKKEELSAICDHMNIQVDNPLNVLTQDSARQFLSASAPGDKYKFFLKGTQLSQLSEEYETCLENIGKTAKVLEQKKEALPDLEKQVKEANARLQHASKAMQQKTKVAELKNELAWATVKVKEDEMQAKVEELAKANRRQEKLKDSFDSAEAKVNEVTEKVRVLESRIVELGDVKHLEDRRKVVNDQIKANKHKIAEHMEAEKQFNQEMEANDTVIAGLDVQIAEETRKLQIDQQAVREAFERKMQASKQAVEEAGENLKAISQQLRDAGERKDNLRNEKERLDAKGRDLKQHADNCNHQMSVCQDQIRNDLAIYGRDIRRVLEIIRATKWEGETPIGPLGRYVKLRDSKWGNLMRAQLGSLMSAFAVTTANDRTKLKRILSESGNSSISIIISAVDIFDYSSGEPRPDQLTVLRALDISDEYVKRLLINNQRIERIFLAPSRLEGQNIVDAESSGVAWTRDLFRVQNYGDGGSTTSKINPPRNNDMRVHLFPEHDPQGQFHHWKEEGQLAIQRCDENVQEIKALLRELSECDKTVRELEKNHRDADRAYRVAKQAHNELVNEQNDFTPVNIAGLEAAKAEAEQNKESIKAQFSDSYERKLKLDAAQPPLIKERQDLQEQIQEFEGRRAMVQEQIMNAAEERLKAQNDLKHWQKKMENEKQLVTDLEAENLKIQRDFEEARVKAELYCDGVEVHNPRKVDVINRNIESLEKALENLEREQGATVEELSMQFRQTKDRYDAAQKDLRDMSNLNKILKSSLVVRLSRWNDFRRHIALRTKLQFAYHLTNRGYIGKLLFNHTAQTLELKVQTDDQAATQSRDKDPRSLSGGEKSFSTICLLLALWEAIGCPIRCLDEFDVFMDAVNRRISMKMMIETANTSDGKQYLLITPQDMSTVSFGPSVRVHRMPDPERGQQALNFAA